MFTIASKILIEKMRQRKLKVGGLSEHFIYNIIKNYNKKPKIKKYKSLAKNLIQRQWITERGLLARLCINYVYAFLYNNDMLWIFKVGSDLTMPRKAASLFNLGDI